MTDKIYLNPSKFENKNSEVLGHHCGVRGVVDDIQRFVNICNNVTAEEVNSYMQKHWNWACDEVRNIEYWKKHKLTKTNRPNFKMNVYCKIFDRADCPFDIYGVLDEYDKDCMEDWKSIKIVEHTFNPMTGKWQS